MARWSSGRTEILLSFTQVQIIAVDFQVPGHHLLPRVGRLPHVRRSAGTLPGAGATTGKVILEQHDAYLS